MNIILINPYYTAWENDIKVEPIGILYISAYLEKYGHNVEIYDAYINEDEERLEFLLNNFNPDVVGCAIHTVHEKWGYYIANKVKNINKNILFVVGGPHPTFCDIEMLERSSDIDLVIRNQAELIFLELLKRLEKKQSYFDIPGITYRDNIRIIQNKASQSMIIQRLDDLPLPSRYKLSNKYYEKYKAMGMISARGCFYKCDYCVSPKIYDCVKLRDIKYVAEEIIDTRKYFTIDHVRFYDDVFAYNLKRVKEIHKYIGPLNVTWECYIRVDMTTKEMLKLMYEAGCRQVSFGVESGNYDIRKKHKGNSAPTDEHHTMVVDACKEIGIYTFPSYILGFPEETKEDMIKTIEFADRLDTDRIVFCKLTPYPGTQYYDEVKDKIIDLDNYCKQSIDLSLSKYVDSNELTELLSYAYHHYYRNRILPLSDPDTMKFFKKD